jgi:predicted transcriptional regulator
LLPQIATISTRRRHLGITQHELAKASGVSQSFIAKLESGRLDPAYSHVKSVFSALDGLEAKNNPTAAEIMTTKVYSVRPSETVKAAVAILKHNTISQVPVIEDGKVLGSLSERWMLELLSQQGDYAKISGKKVRDIMDEPFPSVSQKTPVSAILELLKVSPAVLVMQGADVVGIISKSDLLKATK